jgi:hypothetical protein
MNNNDVISVAILCGNEVIATTDDMTAVHISAALIARRIIESRAAMAPIAEGRRAACRQISMSEG